MARSDKLIELLKPAVEALGYEFWGLEYINQGKHSVLRVYVDRHNGITVDDCANVSHQVSGVLDVEDPISGQYTLEVSSPGLDRPLFTISQLEGQAGNIISVRTQIAIEGRRKFKGKLVSVIDERVTLEVDDQTVVISYQDIEKANLVAAV